MAGSSLDLPELVGLAVFASGSGRLPLLPVAVACFRSIGSPFVGASIACCSFLKTLGLGHENIRIFQCIFDRLEWMMEVEDLLAP